MRGHIKGSGDFNIQADTHGTAGHFPVMPPFPAKMLSFFFPRFRKMITANRCGSLWFAVFAVVFFGRAGKKMKPFFPPSPASRKNARCLFLPFSRDAFPLRMYYDWFVPF